MQLKFCFVTKKHLLSPHTFKIRAAKEAWLAATSQHHAEQGWRKGFEGPLRGLTLPSSGGQESPEAVVGSVEGSGGSRACRSQRPADCAARSPPGAGPSCVCNSLCHRYWWASVSSSKAGGAGLHERFLTWKNHFHRATQAGGRREELARQATGVEGEGWPEGQELTPPPATWLPAFSQRRILQPWATPFFSQMRGRHPEQPCSCQDHRAVSRKTEAAGCSALPGRSLADRCVGAGGCLPWGRGTTLRLPGPLTSSLLPQTAGPRKTNLSYP